MSASTASTSQGKALVRALEEVHSLGRTAADEHPARCGEPGVGHDRVAQPRDELSAQLPGRTRGGRSRRAPGSGPSDRPAVRHVRAAPPRPRDRPRAPPSGARRPAARRLAAAAPVRPESITSWVGESAPAPSAPRSSAKACTDCSERGTPSAEPGVRRQREAGRRGEHEGGGGAGEVDERAAHDRVCEACPEVDPAARCGQAPGSGSRAVRAGRGRARSACCRGGRRTREAPAGASSRPRSRRAGSGSRRSRASGRMERG